MTDVINKHETDINRKDTLIKQVDAMLGMNGSG
jgi:hypothetical protein